MAGQFGLRFRLPRKSQGSFTCHKSATWDRRLYFPTEGRHAVDFFARKIRRLRPGSNPRSWVPEASMLTTRPPRSLNIALLYRLTNFDMLRGHECRPQCHDTALRNAETLQVRTDLNSNLEDLDSPLYHQRLVLQ
jgi:hypothetical protein